MNHIIANISVKLFSGWVLKEEKKERKNTLRISSFLPYILYVSMFYMAEFILDKDPRLFWISLSYQTFGQSHDPWEMIVNERWAMDCILIWVPTMPRSAPQGNSAIIHHGLSSRAALFCDENLQFGRHCSWLNGSN